MLHYNTKKGSKERQKTKPLSLTQEEQVVAILNRLIASKVRRITKAEEKLLQRFINHYQNLDYWATITTGLWVAPEDKYLKRRKGLFQLSFSPGGYANKEDSSKAKKKSKAK